MASSEELSPSKVRKRLKLRRDKALVDTDTHDSSDQSTERNGRSTSHGLLGNGHSTSKKRKSRTTPRRGKDPRSGRKLAAGKDKRLPPVDIPHPDPPHTDSDCIMVSDSEDDDNTASVRKPHVKLSIKQNPCCASGDSWQVPSGSQSFAVYSDIGAYDDTVKREVVGTYATSRSVEQLRKARDDINMVLPDLTNDDRPNLPSASFESRKRHIAPEALDTESSPGEFVVVEQGAAAQWNASRKRYLKTRPPDTKSSSSKCVTTKRGKKATASSKGCILPPVSSKPSSSLVALNGSSNDISSSDETMAAGNDRIQCASHKPAPSTFELSSPDEFTTRMCGKKTTGSRKRHLKPGPSNVDSLSDEPVTSKSQHEDKDSLIKPVSSQSEARLHTSLTPKCGRTLKLSCRRHVKHTRSTLSPNVFVRAEGDHESEYVDPDGSTDSDEPLTDVVMQKMERMQMQEGVPQTSDDVSAHGDNDASHSLPAVKGDHTHTKTKETTLHDDSEQSDSVTSSSHPAASRPPSTDEYRSTSPTFVSKLSREMEDGDVICQRMIAISPPMDVDRSVDITPCDINSVCNEVGSRDDHNTDSRSPQVASPSERAVSHVLESRNKEPQPARSSVKQTVEVALKDIMVCKCAKCSSIRGRFLTPHKDFSATESHSAVKTAVQPHLFTQGGNVYDFVKRNSRNRNFFADFVENMNNVSACPVQSRGKDTTSHCQEGSANSALSTVEAGSIVRERKDILGDLMKMRQDSNNDI